MISGLDPLIAPVVEILNSHGFKTFESCQGGEGHCFPEPTVRFEGNEFDLLRAFEICEMYGIAVLSGKRVFRKSPVYKNDMSPDVTQIGHTWESPFNELTFLL